MVTKIQELITKLQERNRADILRTPAPGCPACEDKRIHSDDERNFYHTSKSTK